MAGIVICQNYCVMLPRVAENFGVRKIAVEAEG